MIKFSINISAWINREIHRTELELFRAEDDLASAQLRVKALQQRVARLKGKASKRPQAEVESARSPRRFGVMGMKL